MHRTDNPSCRHALAKGGILIALGLGLPAAVAAEIDAEAEGPATPWTTLSPHDADTDFHFVIVSDRTGGERPGVFESAMPKVNLLRPAFVVSVGDLIEGYTEDQAQIDAEWNEFEGFVERLEAPFFYVAGNHDMNNAVMAEAWLARFGPSYYRFVYKDVLFLVLNSELFGMVSEPDKALPGPWTQADQLAFVERTLAEYADARWTIVLVHQPLWDYGGGPRGEWTTVERMLGDRDYTVFAGHFHRYVRHIRNDRRYITLSTTGGGSSLRGPLYGEFDHVAWVTMTAAGPRIANVALDGIHDEDLVTEARRDALRALSGAVRSVPALLDGDVYLKSVAEFEVSNRGASVMRVRYNIASGSALGYAPLPRAFEIAPGGVERVAINLAVTDPMPFAAIKPGHVVWSLSTGADPVTVETRSGLLPTGRTPIPSGAVPTLDGDLAEWGELPFQALEQGDAASPETVATDISFAFGLREADGDLYIAAQVTDDSIVASSDLGPQVQDALVVTVDSRPEPERSANVLLYPARRGGHIARMARAHLTVVPAEPVPTVDYLPGSRAEVEWQSSRTTEGYAVEARVPGWYLSAEAGESWRELRIAVTAVDWDADEIENRLPWDVRGSSGVALHWQPDRFGEAAVAGSGTFVRAATP